MAWEGAWPSQRLQLSRQRLSELRDVASNLPSGTSEEVSGAISKFLVVRSAGHIEFTFDECINCFAASKSHPDIASYVRSGLFTGRNPAPGKLIEQLSRLSPSWAASFEAWLDEDDQAFRRELTFLVDRRNRIAHGQNESVRLGKTLTLCGIAIEIGDWLTETVDPR